MNAVAPPRAKPYFDRDQHRFTLEESAALEAAGVLPPDREFELIDGVLIEMPADGAMHRRYQAALVEWLVPRKPAELAVVIDQTLPKDRHNGPKPDLYFFPKDVHENDLRPEDVRWVIEIADTSLDYDQAIKAPLYAACGVPDYWIADVNAKAIIVRRNPGWLPGDLHRSGRRGDRPPMRAGIATPLERSSAVGLNSGDLTNLTNTPSGCA